MTKSDFIEKYKISDAEPLDPSKKSIPAESFSIAIAEFMEAKFDGVVRVKCDDISPQAIMVCSDYVAYFFKKLLTAIYGRTIIDMHIFSDEEGLNLNITCNGELPLSDAEFRNIVRLARNGGFQVFSEDYPNSLSSLSLFVVFHPRIAKRVYAVTIRDGKHIMLSKLNEIFHCGELADAEADTSFTQFRPLEKATKRKRKKK